MNLRSKRGANSEARNTLQNYDMQQCKMSNVNMRAKLAKKLAVLK